jgi:hypothetical protein
MHHVEGAQCGLPLLYHEEGGGIPEAGRKYGIGFTDDVATAIENMRRAFPQFHRQVLQQMPSGSVMAQDYAATILSLLTHSSFPSA